MPSLCSNERNSRRKRPALAEWSPCPPPRGPAARERPLVPQSEAPRHLPPRSRRCAAGERPWPPACGRELRAPGMSLAQWPAVNQQTLIRPWALIVNPSMLLHARDGCCMQALIVKPHCCQGPCTVCPALPSMARLRILSPVHHTCSCAWLVAVGRAGTELRVRCRGAAPSVGAAPRVAAW